MGMGDARPSVVVCVSREGLDIFGVGSKEYAALQLCSSLNVLENTILNVSNR